MHEAVVQRLFLFRAANFHRANATVGRQEVPQVVLVAKEGQIAHEDALRRTQRHGVGQEIDRGGKRGRRREAGKDR